MNPAEQEVGKGVARLRARETEVGDFVRLIVIDSVVP